MLPAPPPELREARRHGLRERRRRLDDPEVPRAVRELPAPVERVRGDERVLARQPGFDGGEDGARIARVPLVREARETRPRRPPPVVVLELPYQRHGAPVLALPERRPGVVAGPEGSRRGEAQVVGIAQRGARGRLQRRVVRVLRESDVRRRAPGAGDAHRRHDFVRHRARLPGLASRVWLSHSAGAPGLQTLRKLPDGPPEAMRGGKSLRWQPLVEVKPVPHIQDDILGR